MNLIPYKFFIYFNYITSVFLIAMPWILTDDMSSAIILSVAGVVSLLVLLSSKEKPFPKFSFIPVKITILSIFILFIFLSFTHYVFNFTDEKNLVFLIYSLCFLTLSSLIFTNINNSEEAKN